VNNQELDPSTFDFSKYRVKNEALPEEVSITESTSQEPFDLNSYKVNETPSTLQEIGRHAARTGSRVAETILGFPGDVIGAVKFGVDKLPKPPEFLRPEPTLIQKEGKKLLEKVPGSADLKEISSSLTSGFTDPQSANEELADEIASLATILVNPSKAGTGFTSLLKNLGSSVGKAVVVKGAGKGAEVLGADEATKAKVELGTLMLTGLLSQKTASKFVEDQYKKSRSSIPKGTMINTQNLERSLDGLEKELSRGISTSAKKEVKSAVSELKSKASRGLMEADEVIESYHNINQRIGSKKLFDELSTSERRQLKINYDKLKGEVGKEIAVYGEANPEFYQAWKKANDGYGTIERSKQVSNFIKSKAGTLPKHVAGSIAIDLFLGQPLTALGAVGGYSAVKSGELLYRIAKSDALREHYMKVILEAGNENLPGVVKHLEALDKEAKKIKD